MSENLVIGRCPLCGREAELATRPFCSRRCADIDLGRWLGGRYVVRRPDPRDEAEDLPEAQAEGSDHGSI